MANYRCPTCGTVVYSSEAKAGGVRMRCTNRQCKSRRKKSDSPSAGQLSIKFGDRK